MVRATILFSSEVGTGNKATLSRGAVMAKLFRACSHDHTGTGV